MSNDSELLAELKKQTRIMAPFGYTQAIIGGFIIGLVIGVFGAIFMGGTRLEPLGLYVFLGAPVLFTILAVIAEYRGLNG